MTYYIYATCTAAKGHEEAVRQGLMKAASASMSEPGTKVYTVVVADSDPCEFAIWEEYADRGAHMTHMGNGAYKTLRKTLDENPGWLVKDLVGKRYNGV